MTDFLAHLRRHPLVPVYYHADYEQARTVVQACYDGGLRVFEFTNRGEAALPVFTALARYVADHCPGLSLGIGTILTPADADRFLDAGAAFVVQPVMTPAVGKACQQRGKPWLPAGATLTEIYQATQLGAEVVKVFPGNVLGPGFIRAVKGPLPWLNLMVTGGVEPTPQSLTQWFGAGAVAVGLGSQLFAATAAQPNAARPEAAPPGPDPARSGPADALRDRIRTLLPVIASFLPEPQ